MRLLSLAAGFMLAFVATGAFAADPVRVEILSVQEQAGRLTATVMVYGPDGQPVTSLPSGSVKAALDSIPLPITGVQSSSNTRPPVSVVLMVDVSGSMVGDAITQAKRALTDFVGSLDPNDQVALMSFDSTVRTVQDFTGDKTLATQAITKLTPLGDTALYDAVIEATKKAGEARTERKLIVLMTDGIATTNLNLRTPSLEAARASGVSVFAIGLGAQLDRPYLSELATTTGGRFLEAPTPAALRQSYANLAQSIKTQYTVTMAVPESVDRSVAAKLTLTVTVGTEKAAAEKALPPLAGALPPPFNLGVNGIIAGSKLSSATAIEAVLPQGVTAATVEYFVDDVSVARVTAPPLAYQLDPSVLEHGNHLLKVVATDARGRSGVKQFSFAVVAPGEAGGFPMQVVFIAVFVAGGVAVIVLYLKKRKPAAPKFDNRIKPWRGRLPDAAPMSSPPGEWQPREATRAAPAADRPLGRVIVMDEAAINAGRLSGIREYEIGSNPMTLGTTAACDIIIEDPEGRIAGEEARLWVQRDRLVYHKLTTLSAMATEGVTSGWQFLDSGEDLQIIGPFRLTFQLNVEERREPEPAPAPPKLRELWPSDPEPLRASSD